MKTDTRHRTRLGSLFRFAVRGLGLLGGLAAGVGGVITRVEAPGVLAVRSLDQAAEVVRPMAEGAGGAVPQVGVLLLLGGAAAVAFWLLVELLGGLFLVTGRKSFASTRATADIALAVALVVVVNALSYRYYLRTDQTRDGRFTLDPAVVGQLRTLDPNSPTTVVVVQKDVMSGLEPDQSDPLTTAAQQKITEKILDLIDELREHPDLTARFDVHVLRTKDEFAESQLAALTEPRPAVPGETDAGRKARERANRERAELKAAVEAAAENSVFVTGNGRVRRLPFHQFYMLDKAASLAPAGGPSRYQNLVLSPQGKAAFVRKLLDLEQKRPTAGVLTIHRALTSREVDDEVPVYTAAGLRAALERNGLDVLDVVLKKGLDGDAPVAPAADTYDESRLDKLEAEYVAAADAVAEATVQVQSFEVLRERAKAAPLTEVDRIFRPVVGRAVTTEADRERILSRLVEPGFAEWKRVAEEAKKELADKEPPYLAALTDDRVLANRRSGDVKGKLAATLADCDLLILPRLTTVNLVSGYVLRPSLFNLAKEQAEAVRAFLAAGKPVLFALGPTRIGPPRPGDEPDDVEKMLVRLGVEPGTQTVVSPVEAAEMAKRRGSPFGDRVELPPLKLVTAADGKPAHPIAAAFDQTGRTVRKPLEVKRSGYRPLYAVARAAAAPHAVELLRTTDDSWNEDRPTPERGYFPKFDPTKPDDPKKGTREEERKQGYLVGLAAELPVPAEWRDERTAGGVYAAAAVAALAPGLPAGLGTLALTPNDLLPAADQPKVRIAVFGHGGLFNGPKLDPGQESLLLHTTDWLLNRPDRLPAAVPEADQWRFPRVPLDDHARTYWSAGAALGLPLAAAALGLIALMLRRLR